VRPVRSGLSVLALGLAVGVGIGMEGELSDRSTRAFAAVARAGTEPPIVDCRTRIQVQGRRGLDRATRRISKVAGPLVLLGVKHRGDVRRRWFEPGAGRFRSIKVPLLLKAGQTVTVSLLSPVGRYAEIVVGLGQPPHETGGQNVELRSCPVRRRGTGRRRGGYLFFPARFTVDGPMCLRITVQVEGRTAPISRRIAFGGHTCEPVSVTRSAECRVCGPAADRLDDRGRAAVGEGRDPVLRGCQHLDA
jgi:hypothetical protein